MVGPLSLLSVRIFAARFYASAALAVMRCLSVCLSVSFVDLIDTKKHIFKIYSLLGSHIILVLQYQTVWQYFDDNLPLLPF